MRSNRCPVLQAGLVQQSAACKRDSSPPPPPPLPPPHHHHTHTLPAYARPAESSPSGRPLISRARYGEVLSWPTVDTTRCCCSCAGTCGLWELRRAHPLYKHIHTHICISINCRHKTVPQHGRAHTAYHYSLPNQPTNTRMPMPCSCTFYHLVKTYHCGTTLTSTVRRRIELKRWRRRT